MAPWISYQSHSNRKNFWHESELTLNSGVYATTRRWRESRACRCWPAAIARLHEPDGAILATAELAETEIAQGSSPDDEIQTIKTVASQAIEMARELMIYAGRTKAISSCWNLSHLVEEMADILKRLDFETLRSEKRSAQGTSSIYGEIPRISGKL